MKILRLNNFRRFIKKKGRKKIEVFSSSFFHFVNIARYFLIQGMTNSIIVTKGELTSLVYTTKYSQSAFFNRQKIGCLPFIFIEVLSYLFSLHKEKKRRTADGMTDKRTTQTLQELRNVETYTTGVAEE